MGVTKTELRTNAW